MLSEVKHLWLHFHAAKRRNSEILRFAQNDNAGYGSTLRPSTCSPFNRSRPLRHLLRERALCAIGIVLHAKVFVDLEQPLLVRDSAQKFFPAGIISKKTRRSGFESPVRQLRRQLPGFCP